ncbi:MAG TPA: class I SAM-dependent methyltransferase [Marmoricola sp.]|nr:class I SAM-dependent methyltransferase [Marmoricola sp.]
MSGLVSRLYNDHVLPRLTGIACSDRATGRWRDQLVEGVSGEVLEVGFANGTNLLHYPAAVRRVYAVEPSDVAWRRASHRIKDFGRPVERIGLDGASLSLPDDSVDAVVSAFTMCTIPHVEAALHEMRRVLRPGGSLHFVEHGLAPDAEVAARQRRWTPPWSKVAGGCHLDRDIPRMVEEAGFNLSDLESSYLPGPDLAKPWGWLTIGRAEPMP